MITQRMVTTFGYRLKLWEATQFTPFEWNVKSQSLKQSSWWRFILWTSTFLHASGYIFFTSYCLFCSVWAKSEVNRTEVALDCLMLMIAIAMAFFCISVGFSRQSHVKIVESLFAVDKYLASTCPFRHFIVNFNVLN